MPPDPKAGEGGATDGTNSSGVDESLYSRQLYVMGHEAQVNTAVGTSSEICTRDRRAAAATGAASVPPECVSSRNPVHVEADFMRNDTGKCSDTLW